MGVRRKKHSGSTEKVLKIIGGRKLMGATARDKNPKKLYERGCRANKTGCFYN